MAWEQKDMQGSLFSNTKREKDTQPHAQGSCMIDGVEYFISAWTKDGKNGKWQSLAFKRKEQQRGTAKTSDPAVDDVPF